MKIAVLLSQYHEVVAFDISEDEVSNINAKKAHWQMISALRDVINYSPQTSLADNVST